MTLNIFSIACPKTPVRVFDHTMRQRQRHIMHRNIDCGDLAPVDLPQHTLQWCRMNFMVSQITGNCIVCSTDCWTNIKTNIITWYDGFLPPVRCISAPGTTLFGPVVCLHCFNFVNTPPPPPPPPPPPHPPPPQISMKLRWVTSVN